MEALRAFVLTETQLRDMLAEAAKQGAALVVDQLRAQLHQSPEGVIAQKLRAYLADPASPANPHDHWAHSGIIRQIEMTPVASLNPPHVHEIQRKTRLNDRFSRPSPAYSRRRERSCFDIKLTWDAYFRQRQRLLATSLFGIPRLR